MRPNFSLVLLVSLVCFSVVSATSRAATVHVIQVYDAHSNLKLGDADDLWQLFYNYCDGDYSFETRGHRMDFYTIGKGDRVFRGTSLRISKSNILDCINGLRVGSDDTVFFLYSGHGGFDKGKHEQYYELTTASQSKERLYHSDVRLAVERKSPRLAVFLRDCCNTIERADLPRGTLMGPEVMDAYGPLRAAPARIRPVLLESLFLQSRGVVDIGSAKVGLPALAIEATNNYLGNETVFTNSFHNAISNNQKSPLNWQQFFDRLDRQCNSTFSDYKRKHGPPPYADENGQRRTLNVHTPHRYVIGGIRAVPGIERRAAASPIHRNHFQFEGRPVYGGVRLTSVDPNGRGESYGFEVGDTFYAVHDGDNGIPVTTFEELDLAIRAFGANKQLKVTLFDTRNGDLIDLDFPDITKQ